MFSNKYYNNAPLNNENVAKPSTKPVTARRRALGDITNNYAEEGQHEIVAKRPQMVHHTQDPINDDNATVMSDRSYMQRPCDDIDSRDADNPLLVTCYVNEMYDNFNQLEQEFRVNHNYMATRQEAINEKMRSILIDWLVSTSIKST